MKQKIFTLFLALFASAGTIFAQSGSCGDSLTWNITNGVLTISGTGAMTKWSLASNVPWYSYRSRITSVIIGNSVTSIETYAFDNCSGLTSVTVPYSVTYIGGAAFSGCSGLTSINVENGNSFYDSRNNCNAIIRTATNTLVAGCQNTTIPNSVTSIGDNAFGGCTSLTSVTIPNSVTSIKYNAFIGCSGLTSIEIPNSVISIDDYAFYECSALTSITCEAITPPYCENHVFYEVNKSIPLYVPAESVAAYQAANGWRDFANIQAIGDSTEITYASIADLYNMAQDSTFTLGAFDVVYVADFQDGANMYIKDETGSMVIYKVGYGLQAGDHVEAGLQGKVNIYHGIHEIFPISTKEQLTVTSGVAPNPIEATEVPSLTNVSQFVVYKNVSFTTDTAFISGRRHIVYGEWNGQEIAFYNQYYIGATLNANKLYDITSVNSVYGITPQAYPLMVEEATPEPVCEDITVMAEPVWAEGFYYWADADTTIFNSGTYTHTFTTTAGCDSIVTLPLYVMEMVYGDTTAYECGAFIWYEHTITTSGEYVHTFIDPVANRDSIVTLHATIVYSTISEETYYGCGPVEVRGRTYFTSGLYMDTLVNAAGCDSIILMDITISTSFNVIAPPVTAEGSYYWAEADTTITTSGIYTHNFYSWFGCDSVVMLDVTILEPIVTEESDVNVTYWDHNENEMFAEGITLHLPVAPQIEGFTFLKWQVVAGDLENGIYIQAVYAANEPASTPAIVTNPANPAQKLIRDGNVYILTEDKIYSITGQTVR